MGNHVRIDADIWASGRIASFPALETKAKILAAPPQLAITSNGGGETAALTLGENITAVTAVTATDMNPSAVIAYSIAGGADAALFKIDANTGNLVFASAPNFEDPADAGKDNVYDVIVEASDGSTTAQQALAVTVANVNEAPIIYTPRGLRYYYEFFPENGLNVVTFNAFDPDAGSTLRFSIEEFVPGVPFIGDPVDGPSFTIDPQTGALSFRVAPSWEVPQDWGGDTIYNVVVLVSDGEFTSYLQVDLTITDVENEVALGTSGADTLNAGNGNCILKGGGGDDILNSGDGKDFLDGGLGADAMRGGNGNDTYVVDNASDTVTENPDAGIDTVRSSIGYALGADVENLLLLGSARLAGAGNALANRITGNAGANALSGGAGADLLVGGAGADALSGGTGRDRLTGGAGADVFVFDTTPGRLNTDKITDFSKGEHDSIRLSAAAFTGFGHTGALTADEFYAADGAKGAHDATDRIIYNPLTGRLLYDVDGKGGQAAILIGLFGSSTHPVLSASDFHIVL